MNKEEIKKKISELEELISAIIYVYPEASHMGAMSYHKRLLELRNEINELKCKLKKMEEQE